jgi:UDPglucose--hexose-1-phosphate uridylyltransferase
MCKFILIFFFLSEHQHIRFNPMKNEWVLVSPHRMKRPWTGQTEQPSEDQPIAHDPSNPLCPGVTRSPGKVCSLLCIN